MNCIAFALRAQSRSFMLQVDLAAEVAAGQERAPVNDSLGRCYD